MIVEWPRRWRIAIAVLLPAMFVALVVTIERAHRGPVASADQAHEPSQALAASGPARRAGMPVPSLAAASAAGLRGDEVQVCGGSTVKLDAAGTVAEADRDRLWALGAEREQLMQALRADPRELAQVAAIVAEMADLQRQHPDATHAADPEAACTDALCPSQAQTAALRDRLVAQALRSDDPAVYATVFRACGARAAGACAMLNATQWSRIDPGNAVPWLYLLDEAGKRRDAQAEAEALYQISVADRVESRLYALPALVGALVPVRPELERETAATMEMTTEVVGTVMAGTFPGYQRLLAACRAERLQDANRRQLCERVADVLTTRADSFIDAMVGAALSRRLARNDAAVARLRGEYEAYAQELARSDADARVMLSCSGMRRWISRFERLGALGEIGVMRQWAVESGTDAKIFEQRGRAFYAQRDAQAASEAAAAAAASAAR